MSNKAEGITPMRKLPVKLFLNSELNSLISENSLTIYLNFSLRISPSSVRPI